MVQDLALCAGSTGAAKTFPFSSILPVTSPPSSPVVSSPQSTALLGLDSQPLPSPSTPGILAQGSPSWLETNLSLGEEECVKLSHRVHWRKSNPAHAHPWERRLHGVR